MVSSIISPESISRTKKEKFLKQYSEDAFRDEIIRPLLLRMGYSDGRDLCGPTEYGKDAVFCEKNKLGQVEYTAIQTKKGNLNLAAKASQNLISAISQLRTALEITIPIVKQKTKVLPSKVVLCASGKINDAARRHIADEIDDTRIHFLDSDEIIPLIDEHYPEFWLGIEVELLPYIDALKVLVEGDDFSEDDNPLSNPFLTRSASDSNYVDLNFYKTNIKKKRSRGQFYKYHEFEELVVDDLLNNRLSPCLLLGDAGFGKTTTLYRLAYSSVKKSITSSDEYVIPVVIKATEYITSEYDSLIGFADHVTKKLSNSKNTVFSMKDVEEGRVVLLVDALDEVASDGRRAELVAELKSFHGEYPNACIIATSRPHQNILAMKDLEGFTRINIHPISLKQAGKIVKSIQKKKGFPQDQSKELLRRIDQVHGIELSPLLITVFAATTDLSRQDIPANITELFKKFTELMLGRWDEQKGLSQQYHAPLKEFLLTRIATALHVDKRTNLSLDELRSLIEAELAERGHVGNNEVITEEIIYRSGLFRIYDDEIEFRHHLLQEFFAGRGISGPEFIKEVINEDWWKNPIVFYFGDNPEDINQLLEVATFYESSNAFSLMQAAITIGIALQACYLSPVGEKLDVWKWVVKALTESECGILEKLSEEDGVTPISDFVAYYLMGRDAVALHNINDHVEHLLSWTDSPSHKAHNKVDSYAFWLVAALIETGRIDEALKILKTNVVTTDMYQLACYLGGYLVKEVRITQDDQKRHASSICKLVDGQIAHLKQKLYDEFGSQLLEVRDQQVAALEDGAVG